MGAKSTGRADPKAVARAIRTRRIEASALGVLALLPIVPYLTFILRGGIPRYALIGEIARIEQATRHVWSGDTLVGLRARFPWNHPGPLFFYLSAPFQALGGANSTGLYVATCLVNGAAAAALVATTRLLGRRSHAIAALVVVLVWFLAFGNVVANPWNPLVITLPLTTFLVMAALFARGKSSAVFGVVCFGALVVQSHVAAVTTVLTTGFVSLVAYFVGMRRRGGLRRSDRWQLAIATSLGVLFFVPPLVEQIASPTGNVTRIWRFFGHREAPLQPIVAAVQQWSTAGGWATERIFARAVSLEGPVPAIVRQDIVPAGLTRSGRVMAIVHIAGLAAAAGLSFRRRDTTSFVIVAIAALGDAVAMSALQAVVGPPTFPLVFWTTGVIGAGWIGIFGAFFSAIGSVVLRSAKMTAALAPAVIVVGLATAVVTTTFQRNWLGRNTLAPGSHPELRGDLRAAVAALRQRMQLAGTVPIIHRESAADIADGVVLELEKDRAEVRIAEEDRKTYVGLRSNPAPFRGVHVYFATPSEPFRFARCTELLTRAGDISIFVTPTPPTGCAEP